MELAQLLKLAQFKEIEVLNHHADLTGNITTVGMMDAPDVAEFMVSGQLLVTTGYLFVDRMDQFERLIKLMKAKHVVAIGIKFHRYLDGIPDEVLAVADQYAVPILRLPDTTKLAVMVRNIFHVILEQKTDQLATIMDDTLFISKYILASRSDNEILDKITKLLNCNAFIINSLGRLTAKNTAAEIDAELFQYTETKLHLLNLNTPRTILDRYTIFPLKTLNKLTRRFVIFEIPALDDDGQSLLIENMINLLSLESMQVNINLDEERRRKSELIETILSQDISEEVFAGSMSYNGLDFHDQYQAFVMDEATSIDDGQHQQVMHSIADYLYWYFAKLRVPVIIVSWQFRLFVLVKTTANIKAIVDNLSLFIAKKLKHFRNRIGYTNYTKPLLHFKRLLREANEALEVAKREDLTAPNGFQPQQVDDILNLIPKGETSMFIEAVLGPLLALTPDERRPSLELIQQYFQDNQSISQAANNLFIHRNTAVYRLKKVEKFLKIDLRNAEDSERLRLAMRLYLINYDDAK